jgi:uncharacterized membrane protein YoaK (UPF0700 family)
MFVSFMSGNTTELAVAGAAAQVVDVASTGGVVALFVAGVTSGRLLGRLAAAWRRPMILVVEAALLALAAAIAPAAVASIAAMALAMGLQNTVHPPGDSTLGRTYVTGTLVRFGEQLADALCDRSGAARWGWAPYLALWTGLALGATAGALAYRAFGGRAVAAPAAVLLALAAASARARRAA